MTDSKKEKNQRRASFARKTRRVAEGLLLEGLLCTYTRPALDDIARHRPRIAKTAPCAAADRYGRRKRASPLPYTRRFGAPRRTPARVSNAFETPRARRKPPLARASSQTPTPEKPLTRTLRRAERRGRAASRSSRRQRVVRSGQDPNCERVLAGASARRHLERAATPAAGSPGRLGVPAPLPRAVRRARRRRAACYACSARRSA